VRSIHNSYVLENVGLVDSWLPIDHKKKRGFMPKVWLITGASRGLGRAFTEAVLEAGDRVVATARNPEQLVGLKERYSERVRTVALDVSRDKSLHIVEGATHIAMYDTPEYVKQAIAQLVPLYQNAGKASANSLVGPLSAHAATDAAAKSAAAPA
jgi:NAD(P)-dependent dehydrogenase (short-subunit alcohol dehydrogenase family)